MSSTDKVVVVVYAPKQKLTDIHVICNLKGGALSRPFLVGLSMSALRTYPPNLIRLRSIRTQIFNSTDLPRPINI